MMALQHNNSLKCLGDLIGEIRPVDAVVAGIPVAGLQLDSRAVAADQIFIACKGAAADGRSFIREAVATGAVAVLAERGGDWQQDSDCDGVPVLVIDSLADKVSVIAGNFYDHPSQQFPVVGVTGTNGKTSCTQLMAQLLETLHQRCAVIGTLGTGVHGQMEPGVNTTPDAVSIQQHLADWQANGIDVAAMEVSSHGLQQHRVAALQFQVALFTNLTRDHLDYHGSMEAYGEAKLRLFQQAGLKVAVVNLDDPFAETVLASLPEGVRALTYSVANQSADVYAEQIEYQPGGVKAILQSPWDMAVLQSPLLGEFNLSNLLASLTVLAAMDYSLPKLVAACSGLQAVDGRMERINSENNIEVVVDYAHTPDALKNALQAVRQHTVGQLWCVFGCGGDRDQGKRPQMGVIAEQLADHVVVTSDNPRSENPHSILDDIVAGMQSQPALLEIDRAKAITYAIDQASQGDVVLVAGKGHECYQQIGKRRFPFSDMQQVRLALQLRKQGERT
jgi:UDP-N-acetylmuramoyl-L-alanyl-D-glutamate--2,6-diaminopimelate ligase